MIIYKATNLLNGLCYIGQTIKTLKTRKRGHMYLAETGKGSDFHDALRTYGEASFKWETLEKVTSTSELNEREYYWINYYDSCINGYNVIDRVLDNPMHHEEVKKKHLASVRSEEFKEKLRKANTGRRLSDDVKQKLSTSKLGAKNPRYGKISVTAKKVQMLDPITLEVIMEFDSGKLAGNYLLEQGLTKSKNANVNINAVARGGIKGKQTAYGYKWIHIN